MSFNKKKSIFDDLSSSDILYENQFKNINNYQSLIDNTRPSDQFSALDKIKEWALKPSLSEEYLKTHDHFASFSALEQIKQSYSVFDKIKELALKPSLSEEYLKTHDHFASFSATEQISKLNSAVDKIKEWATKPSFIEEYLKSHDHLASFSVSEQISKLNSAVDIMKEWATKPSLLEEHLKIYDRLTSFIDLDSIARQFSAVDKISELLNTPNFIQKYTNTWASLSANQEFADFNSPVQLSVHNDGSVAIGNEIISSPELTDVINEFCFNIDQIDFTEKFWSYFDSLRKPVQSIILWIVQNLIITFIISVFANIYTPSIVEYWEQFSFNSKHRVLHQIKKIPFYVNLGQYADCRVVTVERLHLRKNSSIKSEIIEELKRGKLVRVIKKEKTGLLLKYPLKIPKRNLRVGYLQDIYPN